MGRRRSKDRHLPARMYQRRGSYYYVEPGSERWVPLGDVYRDAFTKYGELTDAQPDRACVTVGDMIDRYRLEVDLGSSLAQEGFALGQGYAAAQGQDSLDGELAVRLEQVRRQHRVAGNAA